MRNKLYSMALVLFLFVVTVMADGVEIWIKPTGDGTGTGTLADPYSTPTADSFFELFHGQRSGVNIPEYSTIHLMPGVFMVKAKHLSIKDSGSARYCITMKNGWKIRGAGMDVTILKVIPDHPSLNGSNLHVVGGLPLAFKTPVDHAEISDLTIDSNLQNQNVYAHNIKPVVLMGSHNRISRVKAINWGSKNRGPGGEGGILQLTDHAYVTREEGYTDNVIEECILEQPAQTTHGQLTSGISVYGFSIEPNQGASVIRHCIVKNVTAGGSNQPPGFQAYGIAGRGSIMHDNIAMNLVKGTAVYNDSVKCQDIIIRDNSFINVSAGIVYNTTNLYVTNFVVQNNVITYGPGGCGIQFWNESPDFEFKAVRIEGNTIRPERTGDTGNALAMVGKVQFAADNNVLECGTGGANGFDFLASGGQWRNFNILSFKNNHNLRGTRLKLGDSIAYHIFKGHYDEDFSFTPTNSGWYKVLQNQWHNSAKVNIWVPHSTSTKVGPIDLDFAYSLNQFLGSYGELTLARNGSHDGKGVIPKARIAYYSSLGRGEDRESANTFELYFPPDLVGVKINVRISGMLRPGTFHKDFVPYLAPTSPARTQEIVIGPGMSGTGPIFASNLPFKISSDEIDAKTIANTPLLMVPTGKTLVVTDVAVETIVLSGSPSRSTPVITVGTTSNPESIVAAQSLNPNGGIAVNTYQMLWPKEHAAALAAGSGLIFRVDTASVAATHKVRVHVTGFYR